MLPPGHVAGGYLVGYAFVRFIEPSLPASQAQFLIFLAMASAFAPDLDMFYSFIKVGNMRLATHRANHRLLFTHTPFFWIICGFGIFLLQGANRQSASIALVITLGALSHLLLDSIQYGIRWLYPISKRLYSVRDQGVEFDLGDEGFVMHWMHMILAYIRRFTLTFAFEMILIVTAIIVALRFPLY